MFILKSYQIKSILNGTIRCRLKLKSTDTKGTIMEDLQAVALDILNNKQININAKIEALGNFKDEAEESLEVIKSKRTKKDLSDYIAWLDRQLKVLKNNGQHIVD